MRSSENTQNAGSDLTIIGAGVSGLATGLLLNRLGASVTIVEQSPDSSWRRPGRTASINIALSHRGFRTLEELEIVDDLETSRVPMFGRMVHSPAGDHFQPYDLAGRRAIYSAQRGDVVDALIRKINLRPGIRILHNRQCVSIDLKRRELVLKDTSNGVCGTLHFSHLLGADGCHSKLRKAIAGARSAPESLQCLDHGYKEVNIEPQLAAEANLDLASLHIWPWRESMLIALPNRGGDLTATLFMPTAGPDGLDALREPNLAAQFLLDRLPRHHELVPVVSEAMASQLASRLIVVDAAAWSFEDVALILGDAAHAMTPFFGQGMNCALEDCRILADVAAARGGDWSSIFADFESVRKPDADAIALLSMRNYVEMRNSVVEPEYQRKRGIRQVLQQRHPDRFIPLYAMISFSSLPYAEAVRRNQLQEEVVERLCRDSQWDLLMSDRVVEALVPAWPESAAYQPAVEPLAAFAGGMTT